MVSINSDPGEIRKFEELAGHWWDPAGPMGTLHTINPLRLHFITEHLDLRGLKVLDIGCGGGILAESMAKAGARVVGIDLSHELLELAAQHAKEHGLTVDYRFTEVESLAETSNERFDVITCMEVLEHIPKPVKVVAACAQLVNQPGHVFFSTINRNFKSFLFAIVGAEYVLGLLPRGSHNYRKLIRRDELAGWARQSGLEPADVSSLVYNPFTRKFRLAREVDVDYLMYFIKK